MYGFGSASKVRALAVVGLVSLSLACQLNQEMAQVRVSTVHYLTPQDGAAPWGLEDGEIRTFETDTGWTVVLFEGALVHSDVVVHGCDGTSTPIDMFHGPLAEDLRVDDLDFKTLGAAEVEPGEFCSLTVEYAPLDASLSASVGPLERELDGRTLHFRGAAVRDNTRVEFEFDSNEVLTVTLDLTALNDGAPLRATDTGTSGLELTLAKAYDRFFDGVDFKHFAQADLEQQVLATIAFETRVGEGRQAIMRGE
jgi:hypothetical protein